MKDQILMSIMQIESDLAKLKQLVKSEMVVTTVDLINVVTDSRCKYPFSAMEIGTTWELPETYVKNKAVEACKSVSKRHKKRFKISGNSFTRVA